MRRIKGDTQNSDYCSIYTFVTFIDLAYVGCPDPEGKDKIHALYYWVLDLLVLRWILKSCMTLGTPNHGNYGTVVY